ncbi:D-2-hydroxyacid dehydrogenase [Spirosoma pollinicola]|uniref:D-2-hydroxyacid dehydrogenase n=1 Tax=Spirosoma pollinicola TaxID=2057025 RepID=A0A2K8Z926_9BACT|nr:D-2-hydroxyacid dehydrogenase [Spirosoma pollinicola]AUD06375.1 D-2-hydroxyacid dehydrogenase [Spirosoma pollinicola]
MQLFVNPALNDTLKAQLEQQLPADVMAVFRHDLPETAQQAAFQSADFVLGNPPVTWFSDDMPNMKFWQLDSAGFDGYKQVQVKASIANMGDYFARPCAETMMAGILAVYRCIPELTQLQHRSEWIGAPIRDRTNSLWQKRVVILGTGTIGQAVRQMLTGFACETRMLARTDPHADLHSVEELIEAVPQTDILINCLPGTATGFVSAEVIAAMKPGSLYANVGRGTTTDEPALISALQSGHLGGAVLDVTAKEPLPADSPLWTLPTVLLTQHTGGGQPNEDAGKVAQFLRNLSRFRAGQPLENTVELERGY